MKLFLDTNILIDILERREPFFLAATNLLELGKQKKVELFVSTLTMVNCVYIVRKKLGRDAVVDSLRAVRSFVSISPMGENVFDNAIKSSFTDIEDAVQYYSALAAGCDYIITRNGKHFPKEEVPVMTADEFLLSGIL